MRHSVLIVALFVCGFVSVVPAAWAATSRPALVKRPELVVAEATEADGTNYPLKGGEVRFSLQLTRGDTVIGYKSAQGNLNGFTPVANWSTGKARLLHVKLRVGDKLDVCWLAGTLVLAGNRVCETHSFVKADTVVPYTFKFDLVRPQPIRFE